MKLFIVVAFLALLSGCVTGPPQLTPAQAEKAESLKIYKSGDAPKKNFVLIEEIAGADCSGAPLGGRVWGTSEKAILVLKKKASALNADAVTEVSCVTLPFLNNCWAAKKKGLS